MIETDDPRPMTLTALRAMDPAITIEDAVMFWLLDVPSFLPQGEETEEEWEDPDGAPLPPGWRLSASAGFLAEVLDIKERAVQDAVRRLVWKGVVTPVPLGAGYQKYRLNEGALPQGKALAVVRRRFFQVVARA